MRRLLLLAAVVATHLATGCYSAYPVFPRLNSGFGCGTGACGTPIINRPVLNRPVLNRPVLLPYAGVPTAAATGGGDPGYPVITGGQPVGDFGGGGCSGCGAGITSGYPNGVPLPTVVPGYSGVPLTAAPQGFPGAPGGYPGMPISAAPMPMPVAMPGGVPHDSALLKMPTIMPPGPPQTIVKRPEELARDLTGRK